MRHPLLLILATLCLASVPSPAQGRGPDASDDEGESSTPAATEEDDGFGEGESSEAVTPSPARAPAPAPAPERPAPTPAPPPRPPPPPPAPAKPVRPEPEAAATEAEEEDLTDADAAASAIPAPAPPVEPPAPVPAPALPAAAASAAPAWANPGGGAARGPFRLVTLVLATDALSTDSAAVLEAVLLARHRDDSRLAPVDPEAALRTVPEEDVAAMAEADAQLAEGRRLYDDLELDGASAALTRAIKLYRGHIVALDEPEKLGRAFLIFGAAAQLNGDLERAKAAYKRAFLSFPGLTPGDKFPPEVVAAYETEAGVVRDGAAGTLDVTCTPGPCAIHVDGEPRGLSPTSLSLPLGLHAVVVARRGHARGGELVDVRGGEPTESAFTLELSEPGAAVERLLPQARLELESPEAGPATRGLGEQLGADKVAVVALNAKDMDALAEVAVWDLVTGKRLLRVSRRVRPISGAGVPELATEIADAAAGKLPEPPPAIASTGGGLLDQWWFWAGAGALLVGGATVGVLAATSGDGPTAAAAPARGPPTSLSDPVVTGIP